MRKIAERCYLPANAVILELIKKHKGKFKVSYSITGSALEQFELYAPDVLESFKALAKTGCVEFIGETYSHSLSSLAHPREFEVQVKRHSDAMEHYFGQRPKTFRNTELIYSDAIGEQVAKMGFTTMLTEGAKHVLGWKSPNFVYANANNPKLKILLRNFRFSDDIAFRFSDRNWNEFPLTAEKYTAWLNATDKKDEVVNLFMDYETFGEHQWAASGIFEFLRYLPRTVIANSNFEFLTPTEASKKHQVVAPVLVPHPISWADEERDLTAWLGNELQHEAFSKVYSLSEQITASNDAALQKDWQALQNSDHFYYMSTKWFSDGDVHKYFNPYETPYDAFINYMNVLSDFLLRVKNTASAVAPTVAKEKKISPAPKTTAKKAATKTTVAKKATAKTTVKPTVAKKVVKTAAPQKATVKKTTVKKASTKTATKKVTNPKASKK
ncbi:alpha-amylase [Bacteroidia bacterium]|nr:alpha-amylase [Bacteroidia bacterium]